MKPLPRHDCNHMWNRVSPVYAVWTTSDAAKTEPPQGALRFAESFCWNCGGYQSFPVSANEGAP